MNAAQEAMVVAYRGWRGIAKPKEFVRRVAVRCAAREVRGEEARSTREERFVRRDRDLHPPDPSALAELAEEQRDVLKRIRALSPVRQKILALLFDGHDRHEIARQLEVKDVTVRSHIRHIRHVLDDQWPQSGGDT